MNTLVFPNGTTKEPAMTGAYGPRSPIKVPGGWTRPFHVGTDWAGIGTLMALGDGVVYEKGWANWSGWYVILTLDLIDGVRYYVRYCHLAAPSNLKTGARVDQGEAVGIEGATGDAVGRHVHVEIYKGRIDRGVGAGKGTTVDPRKLIKKHLPKVSKYKPYIREPGSYIPAAKNRQKARIGAKAKALIVKAPGSSSLVIAATTTQSLEVTVLGKKGAKPRIGLQVETVQGGNASTGAGGKVTGRKLLHKVEGKIPASGKLTIKIPSKSVELKPNQRLRGNYKTLGLKGFTVQEVKWGR